MAEGGNPEYQSPSPVESPARQEVRVSPQTEKVAAFLRGKVGHEGVTVDTRGDARAGGQIVVKVPDVAEGEQLRVFSFADEYDVHEFRGRVQEAGGLNLSIDYGRIAGEVSVFGVNRVTIKSYDDFEDMQFLSSVGRRLAETFPVPGKAVPERWGKEIKE